ncbi:MAG TPA: M13 family metallopeptidase [Puia sp.]|jgi:putative endopeptidase|nr:M13 family metallopeptidase [Puia sp.]
MMRSSYALAALAMAGLTASLFSCHPAGDAGIPAYHFVDTAQLDASIAPGDDFFSYANHKWFDTVKIEATEVGAGSFFDLIKTTNSRLRAILDSVSKSNNAPGSVEQKVGDMYASGMDTAAIDKKGVGPIQPLLRRIDSIRDPHGIMELVADDQRKNGNLLFVLSIGPDDKNSQMNIVAFSQGGLGLPDRDYYFKTDSPTLKVIKAYQSLVTRLFILTGDDSANAVQKAEKEYNLEKQMAASHKTNVELRDPQSNYHKMPLAALDKSMPAFGWKKTLETMGIHVDSVNIQQPAFYSKIDQLLKTVPLDVWKDYLRAHVLLQYANRLSSDFVDAQFQYARAITGQQQLKPRAERMAQVVDVTLGEALGQIYVKEYFPPEAKQRMLELVNNLQKSFAARIDKLDWMSDSTKTTAKDKLFAFIKKIGYPDKWRDYSKVTIDRNDYFANRVSADVNEYNYQLSKLGKPVDRTEWTATPPTINAYYNASFNEIVFPAGILQVPFFDPAADDAVNYGGIGAVIGHEMTHGFDDQGAQYDKEGNLKNWWRKEDSVRFAAKTKAVIALYNSFTVLDSLHVNGALTNGENIADIGGVAVAYDAFKLTPEGSDSTKIDGFTPDQRFFLSLARIWRIRMKDQLVRTLVNINEHSPEIWRVNGPLMNFQPFYRAFNVQPGQKMYRPDSTRITIW